MAPREVDHQVMMLHTRADIYTSHRYLSNTFAFDKPKNQKNKKATQSNQFCTRSFPTICPALFPRFVDQQAPQYPRVQGMQHHGRKRPGADAKRQAHPRGQAPRVGAGGVGPLCLSARLQHRRARAVGEELDNGKAQSVRDAIISVRNLDTYHFFSSILCAR